MFIASNRASEISKLITSKVDFLKFFFPLLHKTIWHGNALKFQAANALILTVKLLYLVTVFVEKTKRTPVMSIFHILMRFEPVER